MPGLPTPATEGDSLVPTAQHRTGLITIVFIDLVGSTALKQQVGDRTGASLIQQHHALVRELLRGFPNGEEIETAGDSFLIVFTKPSEAVHFGLLLHARLRAMNQRLGAKLEDRIGIHVGEVVIREQDGSPNPKGLTGMQVDICARVMGLAEGAQILLTRSAFDSARQMLRGQDLAGVGPLEWLNYGPYLLKGIEASLEVCEVGEVGIAPLQAPVGSEKVQRQATPGIERVHGRLEETMVIIGEPQTSSAQGTQSLLRSAATPYKSLAVLPFANTSNGRENEFLADGITEDLITALSHVKGLRVPARTSSFAFKGKNEDIRRIGQLLGVEMVLEGSVRKSGNKLRITAQLVNVRDGFHKWGERYDREMKDVFDIQDDIVGAIVKALQVQFGAGEEARSGQHKTTSTEAYELYTKGRGYWNQRGLGLKKALHYFELALLEDPDYALALAGLADSLGLIANSCFQAVKEVMPRAEVAAERAVQLAPMLAETHTALGRVNAMFRWNWPDAQRCYRRAIELSPTYAPAYNWYGLLLDLLGPGEEAVNAGLRAIELDPLSSAVAGSAGWRFVFARLFERGAEFGQRVVERWPEDGNGYLPLSECLTILGRHEEAVAAAEKGVSLTSRSPMALCRLGFTLAKAGAPDRARQVLAEMAHPCAHWAVQHSYNAMVQFALGDKSAGLTSLQHAFDERESVLPWVLIWPPHQELRSETAFTELWRKAGLP